MAKFSSAVGSSKSTLKGATKRLKSKVKGNRKKKVSSNVRHRKTKSSSNKDTSGSMLKGAKKDLKDEEKKGQKNRLPITDPIPLGEAIDVEQDKVQNVPDIQSVFDESIGFGIANPGETGTAAVERIKAERKLKKAKVKKKSKR